MNTPLTPLSYEQWIVSTLLKFGNLYDSSKNAPSTLLKQRFWLCIIITEGVHHLVFVTPTKKNCAKRDICFCGVSRNYQQMYHQYFWMSDPMSPRSWVRLDNEWDTYKSCVGHIQFMCETNSNAWDIFLCVSCDVDGSCNVDESCHI